jgi:hypothetical protein
VAGMKITVFEGYTIGEIERGIPFPLGHKKPLSIEQKQILLLKDGESLVLALDFGEYANDNAKRLVQWARVRGIHAVRRRIDRNHVRIWRVGVM